MNKFRIEIRDIISKFPFSNDSVTMKLFNDIHNSKNDYKIAEHVFNINHRRSEFTHEKLLVTIFRDILTNRYLFESVVKEANDKILHRRIPKTLITPDEKVKIPDTETLELYLEYVLSRIDINKMDARYKKYIFGVAKNYLNESFSTSGMEYIILKLNRKQPVSNIEYRIMEVGCVDKYIDELVDHVGFKRFANADSVIRRFANADFVAIHPNSRLRELMCGYRFRHPISNEPTNIDDEECSYLRLRIKLKLKVDDYVELLTEELKSRYDELKQLVNMNLSPTIMLHKIYPEILDHAFEYLTDDIFAGNMDEDIKACILKECIFSFKNSINDEIYHGKLDMLKINIDKSNYKNKDVNYAVNVLSMINRLVEKVIPKEQHEPEILEEEEDDYEYYESGDDQ